MKKSDIFQTILFISILLFLYSCFSFHFLSLTKKDRLSKMQTVNELHKSDPNILILGDLHAYNAIIMPILGPKYFSFAQGGDNIRQMFLKLDFAIRENKKIRYVVIPGDYHVFSWYRNIDKNYSRELLYTTNHVLISNLYKVNQVSVLLRIFFRYAPLSTADDWEKYFFILTKRMKSEESTQTSYDQLSQREKESSSMKRVRSQLGNKIIHSELVAAFDQFIDFCEKKNVKIIVVRYPFSKEYGYYAKKYPLDEVNEAFQKRTCHFLTILNYENIFFEKPQYFFNEDHLNGEGAKLFTGMLKDDIENAISQNSNLRPLLSMDILSQISAIRRGNL